MPILPQPPALNPLKDAAKFETINYTTDFENLFTRLDSIEILSILEDQKMT